MRTLRQHWKALLSIFALTSVLILTSLVSSPASAAEGATKGVIAGRVVDTSGAILRGAQIRLQPTDQTASTDQQGEFSFTNLSPGSYKVLVSYVGFDAFATDGQVTAGQILRVDATMQVNSVRPGHRYFRAPTRRS
jgi:protocatechuate 3,4-dioxygenase beta subunit